jgi:hypothetical protein
MVTMLEDYTTKEQCALVRFSVYKRDLFCRWALIFDFLISRNEYFTINA